VARVVVHSGICGFTTRIEATAAAAGRHVDLTIESNCAAVRKLAAELTRVDAFREISFRGEGPLTLQLAPQRLNHPACPVPSGIIKAVEVAAGLALPAEARIEVER